MLKIAIIGARGMIGRQLLQLIEKEDVNCHLDCFGNTQDAEIAFKSQRLNTLLLKDFVPENYHVIFSATEADVIKPFIEKIKESGAIWVDKSSAMRMQNDVPLVVPEVNADELANSKVISSPNCVVIPTAVCLSAFIKYGIENLNLTTCQSVSGAGKSAMSAFFKEMKASSMQSLSKGLYYEHPMALNVITSIGELHDNGSCEEEVKIEQELRKIFEKDLKKTDLSVTTMRVPVAIGHLVSVNVKLKKPAQKDKLIRSLEKLGVVYSDNPTTPLMCAGEDVIFASRLRSHDEMNWSFTINCDNLRKGGGLNAWQIATALIKMHYPTMI